MSKWLRLRDAAREVWKFLTAGEMPNKETTTNLLLALVDVELEEHIGYGQLGNLVDDTRIQPMWRHELTPAEKDAIVQAVWEWYACHTERALAVREKDEKGKGLAVITGHLKFDALMRVMDSVVDERVSGIWRELLEDSNP